MVGRIRRWGGITKDFDGAVVAGGGEELVGRVKCDPLDMALVNGQGFELLKGVAGPNDNLGVEAYRDQEGGVGRPGKVLYIVIVAHQALVSFPVLDWGRLVRPYVHASVHRLSPGARA